MFDVIIVGSGPAGLSAAVYARRAGLSVLVLEKNAMSGGQVLTTYEVDNYLGLPGIGGMELGTKFHEHAAGLGAEFTTGIVRKIEKCRDGFRVITTKKEWEAQSIILAPGASHATLNVPGEERLMGRGVSYCATCDGAFFRGKTVAVAGGGDVAVEDAIFLSRFVEKVILIHRRDTLRAARSLQEQLFSLTNVEILWDSVVTEIHGETLVEQISVRHLKQDSTEEIPVSGIFIAVGIHPDTAFVEGLVPMDEQGYLIAGEDGVTGTPGIFAAGDARTKKLRQIITAVADGANAAISVQEYLDRRN